ncbi:MAG: uridine kinase [bacterium]|jgi:uridine kinase|nr:uridine kinase [candidate division KSB1 bacterium]MDH7561609.1 uridine kinase [bacterium]
MTGPVHRPVVVGIAGGSGSGKGYLVRRLMERLGKERCVRVEQDWYYADLSTMPVAERAQRNFDHPEAIDFALLVRHLPELIRGNTIQRPVYDFALHTRRPETVSLSPAEVILVEGILVLHDSRLRALCDIRVFVEAPEEVRFQRRLARDIATRGRTEESVRVQFAQSVRPMHQAYVEPSRQFADLVIDGCGEDLDGFQALVRRIEQELASRRALVKQE